MKKTSTRSFSSEKPLHVVIPKLIPISSISTLKPLNDTFPHLKTPST